MQAVPLRIRLESKKRASRKAMSREASRTVSLANSAQNSQLPSRNISRHGSDDEDNGDVSDRRPWSPTSSDYGSPAPKSDQKVAENWQQSLSDCINALSERKRAVQGREETLNVYVNSVAAHYVADQLEGRVDDLVSAFTKSIKSETSEREAILALRATSLTAFTLAGESVYDEMGSLIKRTITDSKSLLIKTAAIHALGACAYFGGAGEEELLEHMAFFEEIVLSDGDFIDARDDAGTVTAALEEWGLLATQVEDMEQQSEDAVETFMEQLDSADPAVKIAAGENIALLYEKSYTPQEDDEDEEGIGSGAATPSSTSSDHDYVPGDGPKLIKRYNAYHNTDEVLHRIESLARVSGHHINRKSKRDLHNNFASIHTTIAHPRRGPRFNQAINHETNQVYGSRNIVKIQRGAQVKVDKWWTSIRLAAVRRLLGGGFVEHFYEGNRAIFDNLPVTMSGGDDMGSERGKKTKHFKKNLRVKGWEDD